MTLTLELTPEEEAGLRRLARDRGVDVETVLRGFLSDASPVTPIDARKQAEETSTLIDEWRKEDSEEWEKMTPEQRTQAKAEDEQFQLNIDRHRDNILRLEMTADERRRVAEARAQGVDVETWLRVAVATLPEVKDRSVVDERPIDRFLYLEMTPDEYYRVEQAKEAGVNMVALLRSAIAVLPESGQTWGARVIAELEAEGAVPLFTDRPEDSPELARKFQEEAQKPGTQRCS